MGESNENVKTSQLFDELSASFNHSTNSWKVRQNNVLDAQTNFIYSIKSFADFEQYFIDNRDVSLELRSYAEHRWRNFRRHDAWLALIINVWPDTKLAVDARDRGKDFSVKIENSWIDFDLKVTRYPNSAEKNLDDLQLARWMYLNQSTQNRFHLKNRVFVVASPESSIYEYALAYKVINEASINLQKKLMEILMPNTSISPKAIVLRV